jgi:hypothetical protein
MDYFVKLKIDIRTHTQVVLAVAVVEQAEMEKMSLGFLRILLMKYY